MSYVLNIKDRNIIPHLDIEGDIAKRKDGLFTFTVRLHSGCVVDYTVTEYVDVRSKYAVIETVVIEELAISHVGGGGD